MNGLKKRLDDSKGQRTEELPSVLWAYRTIPWCSTGETPFSMTCGVEAVIPVETRLPTARTNVFEVREDDQLLYMCLDLIEESRDVALIRLANYQQRVSRKYNRGIKSRECIPGDLVLGKVLGNT